MPEQLFLIRHYDEPRHDEDNNGDPVGIASSLSRAREVIEATLAAVDGTAGMRVAVGSVDEYDNGDGAIFYIAINGRQNGDRYVVEAIEHLG